MCEEDHIAEQHEYQEYLIELEEQKILDEQEYRAEQEEYHQYLATLESE